ncbi:GATOR complex protein MIOS-B isoform X2 [Neocloeon triangulifer]|uniref:GATOR complex protein MIOS-B isoform X2 n=1 Tax=Neocloeon triangulifer TaxID=2078957 RepID=UPI00286F535B|nr:GATOR complex protein MIOS-B isoform X2 [Neocloeon triangulifer]
MNSSRMDILWAPSHPDKFVTWGTDIYLYEVSMQREMPKPSSFRISAFASANLVSTITNLQYIKCVAIHPHTAREILMAAGLANGKVALTAFGPVEFDAKGLSGKELSPKHARQCNAVAWNPVERSLLVSGLDKHRGDHSVLLWDAVKSPQKPVAEFGLSEVIHSLAWVQQNVIAVGMNNKNIKIIDIREGAKVVPSTSTKSVYGIAVDPHNDKHIASCFENQITIWDIRNFEKPIVTVTQSKPVAKLSWCPTRHNLLGTLNRDSSSLCLYDVQHAIVGDEEETAAIERFVTPGQAEVGLASFCWHPQHENRLIAVSQSGRIHDYTVAERVTLNFSPSMHLVRTVGRRTLKVIDESNSMYKNIDDIANKMKQRALSDYGLMADLKENGDLANDEGLKRLWYWLGNHQTNLSEESSSENSHPGVRSVLKLEGSTPNATCPRSDTVYIPWNDINTTSACTYRSEERKEALQLCGWPVQGSREEVIQFINQLEEDGFPTRAAAIAIFHLHIRLAIDLLNRSASKGAQGSLQIVAMALSGYSDDKSSIWRDLCQPTKTNLNDPNLRAMFAFLTADKENFDSVLYESGMAVEDRVAFALTFLSDLKLSEYISKLTTQLTADGDLAGLILTGTSIDGLDLLQRYLDITGDIQSVCMLVMRTFSASLMQNERVQDWLEAYRSLLNSWKLWTQRALFDVELSQCQTNVKQPKQQVYVSCNFCGKSISAFVNNVLRNRMARLGSSSSNNKFKISSCPNCRKPLPRCAICLVHMGTPSGARSLGRMPQDEKLSEFSSWFTWCQTCRHGGHVNHMSQWFREHQECPVTACTCRCMSLDAVAPLSS